MIKRKILKTVGWWVGKTCYIQRNKDKESSRFFIENNVRIQQSNIFELWKEKQTLPTQNSIPSYCVIKNLVALVSVPGMSL